jgi:hypothetical protein
MVLKYRISLLVLDNNQTFNNNHEFKIDRLHINKAIKISFIFYGYRSVLRHFDA